MFLIMLYTSALKLLRSSFCGGHFLDLNPNLLLFVLTSSSLLSLFSKKKAFHRIRLMTLSVFKQGTFKQRFTQHKHSFRHRSYMNSTELSKYIWQLRDSNKDFNVKWTILCRARPYSNITKRCDLCTTEKLMIINSKPDEMLNERSELISKCRHENKFYLRNN